MNDTDRRAPNDKESSNNHNPLSSSSFRTSLITRTPAALQNQVFETRLDSTEMRLVLPRSRRSRDHPTRPHSCDCQKGAVVECRALGKGGRSVRFVGSLLCPKP